MIGLWIFSEREVSFVIMELGVYFVYCPFYDMTSLMGFVNVPSNLARRTSVCTFGICNSATWRVPHRSALPGGYLVSYTWWYLDCVLVCSIFFMIQIAR